MKKGLLGLSFSCNLLLLGTGTWQLTRQTETTGLTVQAPPQQAPAATHITPEARPQEPKPFHWREVESEDYPTYIAKLREIGCPEPTIRQIVQGEVASLYAEKRHELQKNTGRPLDAATLRRLQSDQDAAASSIFASAADTTPLDSSPASPAMRHVVIPLVLRAAQLAAGSFPASSSSSATSYPPASSASSGTPSTYSPASSRAPAASPPAFTTPEQETMFNSIPEKFIADLGEPNQDTTDPIYVQRWVSAQKLADDRMRAAMGVAFFNRYQLDVARKEYEASLKP